MYPLIQRRPSPTPQHQVCTTTTTKATRQAHLPLRGPGGGTSVYSVHCTSKKKSESVTPFPLPPEKTTPHTPTTPPGYLTLFILSFSFLNILPTQSYQCPDDIDICDYECNEINDCGQEFICQSNPINKGKCIVRLSGHDSLSEGTIDCKEVLECIVIITGEGALSGKSNIWHKLSENCNLKEKSFF